MRPYLLDRRCAMLGHVAPFLVQLIDGNRLRDEAELAHVDSEVSLLDGAVARAIPLGDQRLEVELATPPVEECTELRCECLWRGLFACGRLCSNGLLEQLLPQPRLRADRLPTAAGAPLEPGRR